MRYPVWIYWRHRPKYDFCNSQDSVTTVLRWGGKTAVFFGLFVVLRRSQSIATAARFGWSLRVWWWWCCCQKLLKSANVAHIFSRHAVYKILKLVISISVVIWFHSILFCHCKRCFQGIVFFIGASCISAYHCSFRYKISVNFNIFHCTSGG